MIEKIGSKIIIFDEDLNISFAIAKIDDTGDTFFKNYLYQIKTDNGFEPIKKEEIEQFIKELQGLIE